MAIGKQINQRGATNRRSQNVINDRYTFEGGLVLEPSPKDIPPGALLGVKNYVPNLWGGYRRVSGYERYDGRTKVSDQVFFTLEVDREVGFEPTVGQELTGQTSAATATIRAIENNPAGGQLTRYLFYSVSGGGFSSGERVIVTGVPANGGDTQDTQLTNITYQNDTFLSWRNLAQDNYRSTIDAVPGSGPVKGVFVFDGELFAFRANIGGTEDDMYRATPTGWSKIDLGEKLYFRNGSAEPTEGVRITGQTSGGDCIVQRVVVSSGTWDAGDAEGYIVTFGGASSFSAGEVIEAFETNQVLAETRGITVRFDVGEQEILQSDIVVGQTSGASGSVVNVVVESGSWEDGTARGYFTTDNVASGPFVAAEELQVASTRVAETEGIRVYFQNGDTEITTANTVDGATSSAQITAANNIRVVLAGGEWTNGDAFGYIVASAVTGTFTQGEDLEVSSSKVAETISAATAQRSLTVQDGTVLLYQDQTLGLGVRYHFISHNFGGHTKTNRMYGVNGAGRAFEFENNPGLWTWDGVFSEIETGMENDAPINIEQFANHLFLAFQGGSIQNSGLNEPLVFNPIVGADEKNIGDEVTNMHSDKNNALFITGRQSTWVLYGEVRENFQLRQFTEETGGIANTMQRMGKIWYIDDVGVTDLEATDRFGNYQAAASSAIFDERLKSRMRSTAVLHSHISRRRGLVEWHFADGVSLVMGIRTGDQGTPQPVGFTEVDYGQAITCITSEELDSDPQLASEERIFFGSSDGYVYEMDSGSNNFDGDEIEAFLRLSYHYSNSPDQNKNYRRATFDLDSESRATIEFSADFDWGERSGVQSKEIQVQGNLGFWDISNWDEFVFGGSAFQRPILTLHSEGAAIGFYIYHKSELEPDHTLKGVTIQWSPLRTERGAYRA